MGPAETPQIIFVFFRFPPNEQNEMQGPNSDLMLRHELWRRWGYHMGDWTLYAIPQLSRTIRHTCTIGKRGTLSFFCIDNMPGLWASLQDSLVSVYLDSHRSPDRRCRVGNLGITCAWSVTGHIPVLLRWTPLSLHGTWYNYLHRYASGRLGQFLNGRVGDVKRFWPYPTCPKELNLLDFRASNLECKWCDMNDSVHVPSMHNNHNNFEPWLPKDAKSRVGSDRGEICLSAKRAHRLLAKRAGDDALANKINDMLAILNYRPLRSLVSGPTVRSDW